jgi:hypothetical protein
MTTPADKMLEYIENRTIMYSTYYKDKNELFVRDMRNINIYHKFILKTCMEGIEELSDNNKINENDYINYCNILKQLHDTRATNGVNEHIKILMLIKSLNINCHILSK